jgi:4-alpha-glucanotransferase
MLNKTSALPPRAGGILLHATSLPGQYGIGDLGPGAVHWLDWLSQAGCAIWQILPLGPTGFADSPYQSFSAFAGNHLLISPEILLEQGLLLASEMDPSPALLESRVDFGELIPWKEQLLDMAAASFSSRASSEMLAGYRTFCRVEQAWLDEYALFMAIKREHAGKAWTDWPQPLRDRDSDAIQAAVTAYSAQIQRQKVRQFLFATQWTDLKQAAQRIGISIVGDIPIFVAHDSADVWAHKDLFLLDSEGFPAVVAGVPPDYFSTTGQRWGNPLYNWEHMAGQGYAWWVARLQQVLRHVDCVRLDHFRGFEAYWEIPGTEATAMIGRWMPGPGHALLNRLQDALGGLPIIAEDLGVITEAVIGLRKDYNLPGMKVMQFGFEGGPEDDFLPHRFEEMCVAYTGTHDNDTSLGWYQAAAPDVQDFCRCYLSSDEEHIVWAMIEALWASRAAWTIVPMQDPLGLDTTARMNYPSRSHGNWSWRVGRPQLSDELAGRLRDLNQHHRR